METIRTQHYYWTAPLLPCPTFSCSLNTLLQLPCSLPCLMNSSLLYASSVDLPLSHLLSCLQPPQAIQHSAMLIQQHIQYLVYTLWAWCTELDVDDWLKVTSSSQACSKATHLSASARSSLLHWQDVESRWALLASWATSECTWQSLCFFMLILQGRQVKEMKQGPSVLSAWFHLS